MSQPFNQRARQAPPGPLDQDDGEFWFENPWETGDHNLSAFERNRVVLNTGKGRFVDVSHLTAADLDSDSRGVAVGDVNNDGMPDLLVRSSGGGPLRVFENRWPKTNWLKVSLRGVESNRKGVGARFKLEIGERTIWRDLFPSSTFLSQLPSQLHVGIGDASQIDRLTVYWPSGTVQVLEDISANQHVMITENAETFEQFVAVPGRQSGGLQSPDVETEAP